MVIKYKTGWNMEILRYANQFGPYQGFLNSFDENAISKALFDAKGHFNDHWCKVFIDVAMDPFSSQTVTIEQGAHQAENMRGGGFCLHFTGRDQDGYAFHFYIDQTHTGQARVFEITYMENGRPKSIKRV